MFNDLKYALRILVRTPGFSLFALITIALAIGANSAIFSVVNGVLFKRLPYTNPDQLVWIWSTRKDVSRAYFSIPNFIDTRDQVRTIDELIGLANWGVNFTGADETERLQGMRISGTAFRTLGIQSAVGRTLQASDENESAGRVVMLSHGCWQRRFGGDPNVLGRALVLNGDSFTVVGILPRDFVIPNFQAEIVAPLQLASDPRRSERGSNFLRVMARLKGGVSIHQTQSELAGIAERLAHDFPADNGNLTAPRVLSLRDELTGGYRRALMVLLGAVGVVLLIACSNLANLQLARAAARQREMAIRTALGASRWQLIRQALAEGLLLGLTGGGLGLVMAIWGKDFLLQLAPGDFPLASNVSVDPRVLIFCAAVSLCVGIAVGLAPAFHGLKTDASESLHTGTRTAGTSPGATRGRSILIIAEIALSLVLLIAAGLVIKSFSQLRSVDPGFAVDRAIAVRLSLPAAKYSSGEAIKTFVDKLETRLTTIPGVESLAAASALPMSGLTARTEFLIAGHPPAKPSDVPAAHHQWVSAKYFETMGIPVRRGRGFGEQDNERGAGVVVIDQELVRRFFVNQDPIGTHIFVTMGDNLPPREYEIVGVVENVKRVDLSEEPIPTFYGPIAQAPKSAVPFAASNLSIVTRTKINPSLLASTVRSELRQIDAAVAVSGVKPLQEFLAESVAAQKFSLILLATFAGTALVLAASGLYAVIAYLVTQRTREIGVRLALGAQRSDVLKLIMGHGLRLVTFGVMTGLLGAFLTTRSISALLFHTSPADPTTFAAVAFLLAAIALLASYLPARRAMRVDPIVALRAE